MFEIKGIEKIIEFVSFVDRINGKSKDENANMIDCFLAAVETVRDNEEKTGHKFEVECIVFENETYKLEFNVDDGGESYFPRSSKKSLALGLQVHLHLCNMKHIVIRSGVEWTKVIATEGTKCRENVARTPAGVKQLVNEYMRIFDDDV